MAIADVSPLIALDKLEDQLTCPVCLNQYDNPKTLPCLHSFCLKCIQKLPFDFEDGKKFIICPICRAKTKIISNNVEGLPSAFFINNLLEIQHVLKKVSVKQQLFCDNCEEQDASGYCKQCQAWLCEGCVTHHKKWKRFSSHEVLGSDIASTPSQLLPVKEEEVMSCSDHNEPLRVYCETCQALICRDCTISTHRDHSYHLVSDVFSKHSKEIECTLDLLKQKVSATTKNIKALSQSKIKVVDSGKVAKQDVSSFVQSLIELLKESQSERIENIDRILEIKLQLLAQQKKEAEIALQQLQSCAEYVEQCLQHGSHQQVLLEESKMVARMKQLNEQIDPSIFKPEEKADVIFLKSDVLSEKAKSIGFVFVGSPYSFNVYIPDFPMVDVMMETIVFWENIPKSGHSFPVDSPPTLICHVVSMRTGHTVVCDIKNKTDKVLVYFTPFTFGEHIFKISCAILQRCIPFPRAAFSYNKNQPCEDYHWAIQARGRGC